MCSLAYRTGEALSYMDTEPGKCTPGARTIHQRGAWTEILPNRKYWRILLVMSLNKYILSMTLKFMNLLSADKTFRWWKFCLSLVAVCLAFIFLCYQIPFCAPPPRPRPSYLMLSLDTFIIKEIWKNWMELKWRVFRSRFSLAAECGYLKAALVCCIYPSVSTTGTSGIWPISVRYSWSILAQTLVSGNFTHLTGSELGGTGCQGCERTHFSLTGIVHYSKINRNALEKK